MKRTILQFLAIAGLFICICGCAQVQNAEMTDWSDAQQQQIRAAEGVIQRLLGAEIAAHFEVRMIEQENGLDVFEVQSVDNTIIVSGSSPVSACRGLKWYLNHVCHCSVSWRGDNLRLPDPLPRVTEKVRQTTPFQYRYFFNNCVYGYSMAWWQWDQWERMLDVMALNGINLPLCLLGQEKVWQATYAEFGLTGEDMNDFFAGPAWYPWQWMGNLDGWGGPLPQSVIDDQCELQKKILSRARQLGMKPVLAGFSGHVPRALKRKYPDSQVHELSWQGFEPTHSLDWQDPLFNKIGVAFLKNQQKFYGTDHFYAVDPFNEMTPPSTSMTYIANMAQSLFESIDQADPQGIWVLMTWFCKSPQLKNYYWQVDRTQAFFDAVPDDRMLALELHGDSLQWTGWFRQNGWYNKPWVWCAIQNFGDAVDIYGGLDQIVSNYNKMDSSPDKGNPVGMGIAMEGLCYNPVVFELLFDMMWGDGVTDLKEWKRQYVLKRYGKDVDSARQAWEILYASRYQRHERTGLSSLCYRPKLTGDVGPDADVVRAWKLLLDAADELKDCPAYQFDLVNLGREAMGYYAPHYAYGVKQAYEAKDVKAFEHRADEMLDYIRDFDRLMATSEHLLLGRWVQGFRRMGRTEDEKTLLEWNAKRQITDWGGNIRDYAVKEWSGFMADYILPQWECYLGQLKKSLVFESEFDNPAYQQQLQAFKADWLSRPCRVPEQPKGDPVAVSRCMWDRYGQAMFEKIGGPLLQTPPGIAVGKPVTAKDWEGDYRPEYAVDGNTRRHSAWWAPGPRSLTVDLQQTRQVFGFQVYPYWGNNRYYQYTIETSVDGRTWSQAVDMSQNTEMAIPAGHLHNFKITHPQGIPARYVRLNMLYNSVNSSMHVVEFKVFDADIQF